MSLQKAPSASRMFLRTLQPSWLSILASIPVAIVLIVIQLLSLSLSTGTAFTNLFNGDLAVSYTTYVVTPMIRLINLNAVGITSNILAWGITGWLLLSLAELGVKSYREWREIENSTQITDGRIINHPMRRTYITRLFWRLGCIGGFILLILKARPVLDQITAINKQLLEGQDLQTGIPLFLTAVFLWMFLEYAVVVLLRLYTFRTRLFGEILY